MLYVFDKDNTLVYSYPGRPANRVEEQILIPGVAERLLGLRQAGHFLAAASNQGGIASGKVSGPAVLAMMAQLSNQLQLHSWRYCHHASWRDECNCRKPRPGMILSLAREFGLPLRQIVFIGDAEVDRLAALAAGVCFIWANHFFGWPDWFNPILQEV